MRRCAAPTKRAWRLRGPVGPDILKRMNHCRRTHARASLNLVAFSACALFVGVQGVGCVTKAGGKSNSAVDLGLTNASSQTYQARWLPTAQIELDGRANDPAWAQAAVEK